MKKISTILLTVVFSILICATTFSEEKKDTVKPIPIKEMSREDALKRLNMALASEKAVPDYFPEIKKQADETGKEIFTFKGQRLENLDKESLQKILTRVLQIRVQIRTERITKQLESIRRAEQASRAAQQASRIPRVVTPPPRPPQPPPTPPATTHIPKAPPSPPRR